MENYWLLLWIRSVKKTVTIFNVILFLEGHKFFLSAEPAGLYNSVQNPHCLSSTLLIHVLALKAPITTKIVCFCHLYYVSEVFLIKQCRPRSDCSCWSSLIWVHTVYPYTYSQIKYAADDFSRQHFQIKNFRCLKLGLIMKLYH